MSAQSVGGTGPRLDTTKPFTRAAAIAAGVLERDLRGGRYRRLLRGVYVETHIKDSYAIRAQAGLCLHPATAFVSHQTGALLRGIPVPACDRVHVSVIDQAERVQTRGLACHVACAESSVEVIAGLRTSSPLDLFVELASELPLVDLVVAGDAMVTANLFSPEELRKYLAGTRRRHTRRARRGARFVRAGVDSPMETRLRMLLVLAGLPEPVINHQLLDDRGRVRRRLDLSYPGVRLVVEYDGRQHAQDTAQWNSDLERREELDEAGWRILVVTSKGIYREPEQTILRVAQALRRRGVRVCPTREEWKAHFPVN